MRRTTLAFAVAAPTLLLAQFAFAATPDDLLSEIDAEVRQYIPGFAGFSAERGERFFKASRSPERNCTSCHTHNPAAAGRHAESGQYIAPLAPAANPQRLSSADRVEKLFQHNCREVLMRNCTAVEKGDFIAYLRSLDK